MHRSAWVRRHLLLHCSALIHQGGVPSRKESRTRDHPVNVRLSAEERRIIEVAHSISGSDLPLAAWARSIVVPRAQDLIDGGS